VDNDQVINKTVDFVKNKLTGESSGHGWEHAKAVWNNAKIIGKEEPTANMMVVELAALLHDINEWKLSDLDDENSAKMAKDWLENIGVDEISIHQITNIIMKISYYGPNFIEEEMLIEGQVVRDADRLEAMGAVAWERTRQFGVAKGIPDINEFLPNLNLTDDEYKNYMRKENSAINHVFEKFLLLKNRLTTKKGIEIGQIKHDELKGVVRNYLDGIKGKNIVSDFRIDEYIKMLDEPRFS
jgi:uncharacterized protein